MPAGCCWLTFAIVIVAPIGEEIVFRGFLYRGLVRPGREMLAIVVISLAWALAPHPIRLARHGADLRRGPDARLVSLGQRLDDADHHDACPDQRRSDARNRDQDGMSLRNRTVRRLSEACGQPLNRRAIHCPHRWQARQRHNGNRRRKAGQCFRRVLERHRRAGRLVDHQRLDGEIAPVAPHRGRSACG